MLRLHATLTCLALLGLCSSRLVAQAAGSDREPPSAWQLVFAADSLGGRTDGSKEELLRAVRAGRPIRLGWRVPWRLVDGTAGVLEHAADAAFLTIHQGEVFAQLAPILGQSPRPREPVVELRIAPAREWYGLLDSSGWLRGYFAGTDSVTSRRVAIHWYAARE